MLFSFDKKRLLKSSFAEETYGDDASLISLCETLFGQFQRDDFNGKVSDKKTKMEGSAIVRVIGPRLNTNAAAIGRIMKCVTRNNQETFTSNELDH